MLNDAQYRELAIRIADDLALLIERYVHDFGNPWDFDDKGFVKRKHCRSNLNEFLTTIKNVRLK